MSHTHIPEGYVSKLNLIDTEVAIKLIKDTFERRLAESLRLTRVSAPLFVKKKLGLNDDLNGTERPVSFDIPELENDPVEIIHSLAKWKRDALYRYGFNQNEGLYTDMNAVRRDETLDNLHSCYVDQWDWEVIITEEQRCLDFLKYTVDKIYNVLLEIEFRVLRSYPILDDPNFKLPPIIHFITTQELEDLYPSLTPKEREYAIAKKYGAVFLLQIGDVLASGKPHDGRAPDYDDWSLNGDIILYYPVLDCSFEISSMGIRVNDKRLYDQLTKANALSRLDLPYHQMIMHHKLPLTMGGGIGQSRLCMFFLKKAHIGEVQASLWDQETHRICDKNNVTLL